MPVTVVVVDDNEDTRLIVRALLRPVHDVMTFVGDAADGKEGLALVRRERPDIVITDLVMPEIEDAYRLMASDSGADAFVNKQVIARTLLPAIGDLLRRRLLWR
jgi:DNA-binding response OmpR family regulator